MGKSKSDKDKSGGRPRLLREIDQNPEEDPELQQTRDRHPANKPRPSRRPSTS
jgi:hypothetical protein